MSTFELVANVTGDGDLPVRKYKLPATGMTAVIAQVDGPIVNGYLTFATEAHDDDGIPHTLEHLVFMGSKDYPYKGVLDLLANRCLASGTNAWTDTDHTCYTMTTAGADGFLNLLPVYLDHCLHPTLNDASFVTEVHHVNEDGEDAGVVYCEMQGRENSGESRCHLELLRAMYPGHCGYKSETGGLMKNLRESTTNEKIRKYHAEVYRPENLCVIITGRIADEDVLKCLVEFEQKILDNRKKEKPSDWVRPWQNPVPPLANVLEKTVEYPCDDDNNGLVYLAWRGPKCTTDFETTVALEILFEYLNDNAASPFQQAFVETEDPYCSSVSTSLIENSESCIYLSFESVPKDKLDQVRAKLFDVLSEVVNGTKPFDEKRMASIIHRNKLQHLSAIELSPHMAVASAIIGDFLYGSTDKDLLNRVQRIPIMEKFEKMSSNFWLSLIDQYFMKNRYILIIGKPCPILMEKMSDEEKQRIEAQREALGEKGLQEKAKTLELAIAQNEILPPPELIANVPIPSAEKLHFHEVRRLTNASNVSQAYIAGFGKYKTVPFRIQVDDLKSNFITVYALLNTSATIPPELRIYLQLWINLVLESSIQRDGKLIPYEEVVVELADDTISSDADIGINDRFSQVVTVSLKVELTKYSKAINWLKELLYSSVFTEERVKVVAKRIFNDLALEKRKGNRVARELINSTNFTNQSNKWASSMFRQQNFLTEVMQKLETNPQSVLAQLDELRELITSPENLTIHIALNATKVCEALKTDDLVSQWSTKFLPEKLVSQLQGKPVITNPVQIDYELLEKKNINAGSIAGVGSVESNYFQQSVESIKNFTDPDVPVFLVLMQYLTQLEGPMWRQIRGIGLSYHYNISLDVSQGLVYFVLFKSTHVVNAYKEAVKIVDRHISGEDPWEQSLFESARSSLVFELIECEKSVSRVSIESMRNYIRGVDMGYTKFLVEKVMQVTIEDMKRVAPIYLRPLFDVSKSRCSVCCHPSKVEEVTNGFKEMNRDLSLVNLDDSDAIVAKL
ncbi:hypothetical protein HDE_08397 [Halotydeus destructor]|nr:hypothetical protein HDE_08397 [Halotydeus destructor]